MPVRRSVPRAAALILGLLACSPCAAQVVSIVSPSENDLVVGDQLVVLYVSDRRPPVERVELFVGGRPAGSARGPDWKTTIHVPPELSGAEILAVAYAGGKVVGSAALHPPALGYQDRADVLRVQLYPVVTDRSGRYVKTLQREDFEVYDGGRKVRIDSFSGQPEPLKVWLLLDASRSMFDSLGLVQYAATRFVDQLAADDEVAVCTFGGGLSRRLAPTKDRDAARQAIAAARAGGGTALNDALVAVIHDAEAAPGRKALVLFSDGRDERSLSSLARVIGAARRSEILIYTIGTMGGEIAHREMLAELSQETGGLSHFVARRAELPEVFDAMLRHLGAQYVLSYKPPSGSPGLREVEVRVRAPGCTVLHRKTYFYRGELSK